MSGQSNVEVSFASENSWSDVKNRLDLAIGDFLALVTFAAIGRNNHDEGLNVFETIGTAMPFLLAWFGVSPFFGTFNRKATASVQSVFLQIVPGWIVTIATAMTIRGVIKGSIPPTPFIIVASVATFLLLSLWRAAYISLVGGTSDEEYRQSGFLEVFKMIGTLIKRW